jgi:hypothetical protein
LFIGGLEFRGAPPHGEVKLTQAGVELMVERPFFSEGMGELKDFDGVEGFF